MQSIDLSKKKAANWLSLAAFIGVSGGGAAPPVKPSKLCSFLLPIAAKKRCGIHKPRWQFIKEEPPGLLQAPGSNSNRHFTL